MGYSEKKESFAYEVLLANRPLGDCTHLILLNARGEIETGCTNTLLDLVCFLLYLEECIVV